MQKVIVEKDSMILKMAIDGSNFSLAPTGALVHEIKAAASSCFSVFSVSYCPRSSDSVAHERAARGCKCSPNADLSWDCMPESLENLVAGDLTVLLC